MTEILLTLFILLPNVAICKLQGGRYRIGEPDRCAFPTLDSGRPCNDDSQCTGGCIPFEHCSVGDATKGGKCAPFDQVGIIEGIKDGKCYIAYE